MTAAATVTAALRALPPWPPVPATGLFVVVGIRDQPCLDDTREMVANTMLRLVVPGPD